MVDRERPRAAALIQVLEPGAGILSDKKCPPDKGFPPDREFPPDA